MGELGPFLEVGPSYGAAWAIPSSVSDLGPLELCLRRDEHVDRLAEELEAIFVGLDEASGASTSRGRGADAARYVERFLAEGDG
jgi:hypothetical protein